MTCSNKIIRAVPFKIEGYFILGPRFLFFTLLINNTVPQEITRIKKQYLQWNNSRNRGINTHNSSLSFGIFQDYKMRTLNVWQRSRTRDREYSWKCREGGRWMNNNLNLININQYNIFIHFVEINNLTSQYQTTLSHFWDNLILYIYHCCKTKRLWIEQLWCIFWKCFIKLFVIITDWFRF